MGDLLLFIVVCAAIAVALYLYFLPAVIASNKKLKRAGTIFWLNLFLGGTGVGWIILLIWACTNDQ
jgi:hypothetical protein